MKKRKKKKGNVNNKINTITRSKFLLFIIKCKTTIASIGNYWF